MISFSLKDCRRFTPTSLGGLSSKPFKSTPCVLFAFLLLANLLKHSLRSLWSKPLSVYNSKLLTQPMIHTHPLCGLLVTQPQTKKACHFCDRLCDSDWIRTNGPHLRRMTLYPAELPNPTHIAKYCLGVAK